MCETKNLKLSTKVYGNYILSKALLEGKEQRDISDSEYINLLMQRR